MFRVHVSLYYPESIEEEGRKSRKMYFDKLSKEGERSCHSRPKITRNWRKSKRCIVTGVKPRVVKKPCPAYKQEYIDFLLTSFSNFRCLIDFGEDDADEGKMLLKTHVTQLLRMSRVSKRTSRSCIAVMRARGSTVSVSARRIRS